MSERRFYKDVPEGPPNWFRVSAVPERIEAHCASCGEDGSGWFLEGADERFAFSCVACVALALEIT